MYNIFSKLTQDRQKTVQEPIQKPVKLTDAVQAVAAWQKDPSKQNTGTVLKFLQPTINSALKSYTPGQQKQFKIKATKLALDSLSSYDPTKKASPATHVFTNLQRLNRIRQERSNIIHIPQDSLYKQQTIKTAIQKLNDKLDREPTMEQIADQVKLSPAKIQKLMGYGATINDSAAINPQTMDSSMSFKDVTDDDYLTYLYNSVDAIDKRILEMATGFRKGKKIVPNMEIAKRLHLSPGAVSQRKAKMQSMMSQLRGLV